MRKYDCPPREDIEALDWMRKASRAFENAHPSPRPEVADYEGLIEDLRELEPYRAGISAEDDAAQGRGYSVPSSSCLAVLPGESLQARRPCHRVHLPGTAFPSVAFA